MKILTGPQMQRWDWLSIHQEGRSQQSLMERAAQVCFAEILALAQKNQWQSGLVVCGPGNNGADGRILARLLAQAHFAIDCIEAQTLSKSELAHFPQKLKTKDFIVDAIFGVGLNRKITSRYKNILELLNQAPAYKIAIDIPSGIDASSGKILGTAFRADCTITFEVPKWGQLLSPAWDFVGELRVRSIGLSPRALKKIKADGTYIEPTLFQKYFRRRPKNFYKGRGGRLLVLAGSQTMPGAAYLSSLAAFKTGCGLVTWGFPAAALKKIDLSLAECILLPLPSTGPSWDAGTASALQPKLRPYQALALGPGLGQGPGVQAFLAQILKTYRGPKVLDADALNALAENPALLKLARGALLTPHPGEFCRLSRLSQTQLWQDSVRHLRAFARRHQVWIILKCYRSLLASPRGEIFVNSVGDTNLATAGSGDVLTGILASLLAQGLPLRAAAPAGLYLHGLAGDQIKWRAGERGTLASEIAREIPFVLKKWIH